MVVLFRRSPKSNVPRAKGETREQQDDGHSETRSLEVDEDSTAVILAAFEKHSARLLEAVQARIDRLQQEQKILINKIEANEELLRKILEALSPSNLPTEMSKQTFQKSPPFSGTPTHQIRPINHPAYPIAAGSDKAILTFFRYQKPPDDVLAKFSNVLAELKTNQESQRTL